MGAHGTVRWSGGAACLALAVGCAGPVAAPPAPPVATAFDRLRGTSSEEATRAFLAHGAAAARYVLSLPLDRRQMVVECRDPALGKDAPPDSDFVVIGYLVHADEREWVVEWSTWGGPPRPGADSTRTSIPVQAIRVVSVRGVD